MTESRTIREARERLRALEAEINAVRLSPAMALCRGMPAWYLRQAQARLRAAERDLAKADDPRLPRLEPLAAQVEPPRREPLRERRRRFRCAACLTEYLEYPSHIAKHPAHERVERIEGGPDDGGWRRVVCGSWEPVGRLPRGKASA